MRGCALLIAAVSLVGCGNSTDIRLAESAGTPPDTAECQPHLNPTAGLGLPGIRIGDNLPATEILQQDPEKGTLPGSPLDDLPPHITQLTQTGQRAGWSPDGTRLLYLDGTIGDGAIAPSSCFPASSISGG